MVIVVLLTTVAHLTIVVHLTTVSLLVTEDLPLNVNSTLSSLDLGSADQDQSSSLMVDQPDPDQQELVVHLQMMRRETLSLTTLSSDTDQSFSLMVDQQVLDQLEPTVLLQTLSLTTLDSDTDQSSSLMVDQLEPDQPELVVKHEERKRLALFEECEESFVFIPPLNRPSYIFPPFILC